MTIEQMRAKIRDVYPGDRWVNRVRTMPDNQVQAVYMRMLNQNKL